MESGPVRMGREKRLCKGVSMSYIDILIESAEKSGNNICMGLDPIQDVLPFKELNVAERITKYFDTLFSKMVDEKLSPAAFKPNLGYYAALDRPRERKFDGSIALSHVMDALESYFPGIPVILDSKRGDIARSSGNYAKEAFDSWKADAVTVSPYMGSDSVLPFAFEGKGMYVLNRTSNPGGAEIQNRSMLDSVDEHDVYPLYIAVSHAIVIWAEQHKGTGAVVGATNMREFADIAKYFSGKEIPMLIPGVGSQGGSASDVMSAMAEVSYDKRLARINSSSGLTHPWKKGDAPSGWLEMCISSIRALIREASL